MDSAWVRVDHAADGGRSITTEPRAFDEPRFTVMVAGQTPLVASQVVDIGPSAVTAITASSPLGNPRGFTAQISAETLDPTIGAQDLVLSWSIPVDVDSLCSRAGLSAEQVASQLLRLELDGRVASLPGGLYQRLETGDRR